MRVLARAAAAMTARHDAQKARPVEIQAARVRVHGDYHLGQVLWAEGDFYLLDFEGEPARPLHERRQKESPLKDVAGMLRSFSYAAYAALFNLTTWAARRKSSGWSRGPAPGSGGPARRSSEAISPRPGRHPSCRRIPFSGRSLLDLLLVDKALYELNYELNNRPDWVRIPLRGLSDLLP